MTTRRLSNHFAAGRNLLSDATLECLEELSHVESKPLRKVSSSLSEVLHVYVDASF